MPWWAYGYWILFAGIGFFGIVDDLRHSKSVIAPAIGGTTVVAGSFFYFSYWNPSMLGSLGGYAVPLFVAAIAVEIIWSILDFKEAKKEEESDLSSIVIGTAIAFAILLPAYVFGGIAVFRD